MTTHRPFQPRPHRFSCVRTLTAPSLFPLQRSPCQLPPPSWIFGQARGGRTNTIVSRCTYGNGTTPISLPLFTRPATSCCFYRQGNRRRDRERKIAVDSIRWRRRNGDDREGSFSFTGFSARACPRAEGACLRAQKLLDRKNMLLLNAELSGIWLLNRIPTWLL
ncbi:uncharacterized protein LOC143188342 [Calliopsis andreniformis]|uniref:uncharacterized protein LOC143188342 n=1 Tax=Calliopsis andreniformis TaxID=337506 RepID=UPI003FCDD216